MAKRIWTRRDFIAAASAAGGFALGRASLEWGGSDETVRLQFEQRLPGLVRKVSLPPEVGEAFLTRNPGLDDMEPLSRLLQQRLQLSGWWIQWTGLPEDQELLDSLAEAVRRDFERPQGICNLHGWYLSQTECHLAAARVVAIREGLMEDVAGPALGYAQGDLYPVDAWGPQSTPRGEAFNAQPDGSSAFWFHISGAAPSLKIYLGRLEMNTTVRDELVTASLPAEEVSSILRRSGRYKVVAADPERELQQTIGEFLVLDEAPQPSSEDASSQGLEVDSLRDTRLKTVLDWGPKSTPQGRPFNPQPSGASAFWIDVRPDRTESTIKVYLGNRPLRTTVSAKVITASIPAAEAESLLRDPGRYPLYLVSRARAARQKVGDFVVEAPETR
ncbi:MAG TPA: hypothetical protein VLV83_15275 [Acidobacteriota bacterium]|nr:hypothetical protein [Acidobacteriota bacterium]